MVVKSLATTFLLLFAAVALATDTGGMVCGAGYSGCRETAMELRSDEYQECMADPSFNPDSQSCPANYADCKSYHCSHRAEAYYNQYINYCEGLYCGVPGDSPILIYRGARPGLTGLEDGVHFDIDADGIAEPLSWTEYGSTPFLALDRNVNGTIDDGSELFGTATVQFPYPGESRNGFAALRLLDANNDYQIDASDPEFDNLLLWRDWNQNGVSEAEEVTSAGLELREIGTGYVTSRARDRHGNLFPWMGRGTGVDGSLVKVTDVVFLSGE